LRDNMTEEYWSRFPDTYDSKMEYVVGRELLDEIVQELCQPLFSPSTVMLSIAWRFSIQFTSPCLLNRTTQQLGNFEGSHKALYKSGIRGPRCVS